MTVTGKSSFNDVKAVPLGDNLFRFTLVEAGQPFRLFDSHGNLLIRDRGGVHFTIVFDTLGDGTPGGVVVEELEPSVRGPHPGFDDATLCPDNRRAPGDELPASVTGSASRAWLSGLAALGLMSTSARRR